MAVFHPTRAVMPTEMGWPRFPSPLISIGQSGKAQVRSTQQVGRSWSEVYGFLDPADTTHRDFLATVESHYRTGTSFACVHPLVASLPNGGGTPLVNGGSQTGTLLVTDGWTPSVTAFRSGQFFHIAGLSLAYEVIGTQAADGSGNATFSILPPIFAGGSPADNAALDGTGYFNVRIIDVQPGNASRDTLSRSTGMRITFLEVP